MVRNKLLADNITRAWNQAETGFNIETSGSTGEPKRIILERNKIIWSCQNSAKILKINARDAIFCCLPVNRIAGFMQIARSLVWNIPVIVSEPKSNPLPGIQTECTITSLTPMQLHEILANNHSKTILNQFRVVLIGGGELDKTLEQKTLGMQPIFYHTYGMTETYSHIALRQLNRDSGFILLPENEIKINMHQCLCVRNFITDNNWLETHDLAEIHGNTFRILGRTDNVINTGGIKFSAEKIERLIYSQLNIPEGSIFFAGIADEKLGRKPVLFVNKTKVKSMPNIEHIFTEMPYAKPREIIYKNDFFYTETGKIQRQKSIAND